MKLQTLHYYYSKELEKIINKLNKNYESYDIKPNRSKIIGIGLNFFRKAWKDKETKIKYNSLCKTIQKKYGNIAKKFVNTENKKNCLVDGEQRKMSNTTIKLTKANYDFIQEIKKITTYQNLLRQSYIIGLEIYDYKHDKNK